MISSEIVHVGEWSAGKRMYGEGDSAVGESNVARAFTNDISR